MMHINLPALPCFAVAAALLASPSMYGATVDSFDFTEPNVYQYSLTSGVNTTGPVYEITGSFTGAVEPDGFIEQSDLSAFSVQLLTSTGGATDQSMNLSSLTLFSFDTNGGASSLDFAGPASPALANFCMGAATSLDPNCTLNFGVAYPAGTVGAVLFDGPEVVSSSFPQITLVSSVTTTPPSSPATVPEPRMNLLAGLLLLATSAVLRRFSRRRA